MAGCRTDNVNTHFQNHGFDKEVMKKLPLYDSLASVLLENYPSIQPHTNRDNYYRYIPAEDGNDLYRVLPKAGAEKVKQYLTQLGTNCIYGFEIFKDSTIKILIRDTYLQADHLSIRERLSFYPPGSSIRKREFPVKDTTLNKNWQYWIWFDEDDLF